MTSDITPSPRRLVLAMLAAALLLSLTGCGGNNQGPLAIIGSYKDNYGYPHVVTQTTWDDSYTGYSALFHILDYSNGLTFLLAQNDAGNTYDPNLYSRFTWTIKGSQLYYCQDPYNAASEDAARNASSENDNDPASKGCGASAGNDFAWTELTPQ